MSSRLTDAKPHYSLAEYQSLTRQQQEALERVARYLPSDDLRDATDELLSDIFGLLRPCMGCILPDEEVGDDLLLDVRRKFACLYFPAIELAARCLESRGWQTAELPQFMLLVDPSYDDVTRIAVIDGDLESRPYCYLSKRWKAWDFATLREIADFVLSVTEELVATATSRLRPTRDAT